MHIVGKKVVLRAIEKEDLHLLQKWANDPDIQYMLGGWHFPTNQNDQEKWFHSLSCSSLNQRFMVVNNEHTSIGMANLININFKDGNAELGLLIDKQYQKMGYGEDIVFCLMNYGFNELRLNRIETSIIEINQPSLNLFINKCGWKKEGILRNWYFRKGQYIHKNILGILRDEFLVKG